MVDTNDSSIGSSSTIQPQTANQSVEQTSENDPQVNDCLPPKRRKGAPRKVQPKIVQDFLDRKNVKEAQ